MNLTRYIQELLFQYECVTIPQLGAFLTRSLPAQVSMSGSFYPPRKEVTFNQLLTTNDGILAHYYAKKESVSYEHALRLIEKEVSNWKKRLKTQTLRFPGVGEIQLNLDRKIIFNPWVRVNFEIKSFGLSSFDRKPLHQAVIEPKIISLMENKNNDDLMFTPENEGAKKSGILRYAVIGIIGIALVGASYYFGDQYVAGQRVIAQKQAQKQIEKNVQEATFDLGSLSAIEVNVTAEITPEEVVLDQIYYSIIAGSFRSIENAKNKIDALKGEGYDDAALAEINPEGLYRAAYGRFTNKKEAINLLYFLKYTLKEDAWYLEEK
ncbi:MAG: hypothetical protein ACI9TK_000072 [Flavobacteriaceae bacterium]|jgi:hypothetical protein|tara:strand:+ start:12972 stop:13937 length:966 start_codon:yes stop_codon:yes gene_type:complete